MSLLYCEEYSSGLLSYHCNGISLDQGVPRQVRMLLFITLLLTYILARLSLDYTLPLGGYDIRPYSQG